MQLAERGQRGVRLARPVGGVGDGEGELDPRFTALALEELRRHLEDAGPALGPCLEVEELPEGGWIGKIRCTDRGRCRAKPLERARQESGCAKCW
jgi:hypothetical protein